MKTIEELISDYNYYMNERHALMNRLDYWVGSEEEESAMHDKISELSEKIYTVNVQIELYHKLRNRNMVLVKK